MFIKQQVVSELKPILRKLTGQDVDPNVSFNEESRHGDYSTNVALIAAKKLGKNPMELAENIAEELRSKPFDSAQGKNQELRIYEKIEVVKPGFINFWIKDEYLIKHIGTLSDNKGEFDRKKEIVLEFSDPNPFKELHAGHLYTSVVGDAMGRLLSSQGAKVHNVNYGGDVGLHVGKTIWAILQKLGGENPEKLDAVSEKERSKFMAECYVTGTSAYEDEKQAKQEIIELNKKIYALHSNNDHDSALAKIYWTCRQWSYDYFNEFYNRIGVKFEKYYPESEIASLGLEKVKEQLGKGVFKESEGAVVFEGEQHGLHTRVFVNSQGLPTYEAKDIGLVFKKWEDYKFDRSIIITGAEQAQYMQVVLAALSQFVPDLAAKTTHLTHGLVKLKNTGKMSSRKGNILRADDVLNAVFDAVEKLSGKKDKDVALGAVKYAFLKQGIGGDIIFDIEESVSLEGNSGPYVQYAYVRTQSVLAKSEIRSTKSETNTKYKIQNPKYGLEPEERELLRLLAKFDEVVEEAAERLAPNIVATYLFDLAQSFNLFYQKHSILNPVILSETKNPRDPSTSSQDDIKIFRLFLTSKTGEVIKSGLGLLGIEAPAKM